MLRRSIFRLRVRLMSAKDAIADMPDGATIALGGFGLCGHPFGLLEELHTSGKKDLTLIGGTIAGPDVGGTGPLAADGRLRKCITTYIGENKTFFDAFMAGKVDVELCPMGSLITRLFAAGSGIHAFYTPTGYGTAVQTGHLPVRFDGPGSVVQYSEPRETRKFNGRWCTLETALYADYAFVRAWKADKRGNIVFRGTTRNFNLAAARAAKITIVEVEEVVENGTIDPTDIHLPGIYVNRIVNPKPCRKGVETIITRPAGETDEATRQKQAQEATTSKHRIARRAALEITNGMYLNLGVGVPNIVASYLDPKMNVMLQGENGILGLGPHPLKGEEDTDFTNAGKQTVTYSKDGASLFDSMESFTMIRGGHMDLTMLGALQVSTNGDLASWFVPGKMLRGIGGAMDLVSSGIKTIVLMEHVAKDGQTRVVDSCSIPLTGPAVVGMLITDLAVFRFEDAGNGLNRMVLAELAEGVTVDEVKAKTTAKFTVSPDLKTMPLTPVLY